MLRQIYVFNYSNQTKETQILPPPLNKKKTSATTKFIFYDQTQSKSRQNLPKCVLLNKFTLIKRGGFVKNSLSLHFEG
jgi:hypothetical protein